MKKEQILIPIIALVFFFFASCKKETTGPVNTTTNSIPLAFSELKAANSGIRVGETTVITATCTGSNLSYNWTCTAGTIVGEGAEVTYGSTCNSCKGVNQITCTVSDGTTSQTKSVEVSIK